MATIEVPTAGDPIKASWGDSVADAINNTHDARIPFVNAMGLHQSTNHVEDVLLSAESGGDSGAVVIPFLVPITIDLVGYAVHQYAGAGTRAAEFRLYKDTGSTTLEEVPDTDATLSFSASGESVERATLTVATTVEVPPGLYWLAIRGDNASTFALSAGADTADWSDSSADNHMARGLLTSSTGAFGTTLDISSFTALDAICMARLEGAVFGESTRF